MKLGILPSLAALVTFSTVLGGVAIVDHSLQKQYQISSRGDILNQVSIVRAKLEGGVNKRLFLSRGLVAYVSTYPDIGQIEFEQLAQVMVAETPGITIVALYKNNAITHLYPYAGNESMLGFNPSKIPQEATAIERAIRTRKTVLAGPVIQIQTGEPVLISRTPIFITSPGERPETGLYWGFAGLVINRDTLFEEAGLFQSNSNIQYSIRGQDALGLEGEIFFGPDKIWKQDPIISEISLPGGSWQIAAIPVGGWIQTPPFRIWLLSSGGFLSLLSSILIFNWLRDPERLREAIAEAAGHLIEKEAKYRELVDNASTLILRVDTKGYITFFNEFAQTFFGYSEYEVIGQKIVGKILPLTDHLGNDQTSIIWDCLQNSQGYSYSETQHIVSNNEVVWVAWRHKPLLDSDAKLSGILCIGNEITARKEAEIALQASEAELRALFAAMNDVIVVVDREGRYLKIVTTNSSLLYKPNEELIGKTLTEIFPSEIANKFLIYIRKVAQNREIAFLEYELPMGEEKKWFAATISPLVDGTMIVVARDITERKQAEESLQKINDELEERVEKRTAELQKALERVRQEVVEREQAESQLRESQQRWELALKGSNDGIWDWNIKTNKNFISVRSREMLGYLEDEMEMVLDSWTSKIHPADGENFSQILQNHLQGKTPYYVAEYRIQCKDGSYKWVLDRGQALWDEAGNPIRMVGSVSDITERKQAEESLRLSEVRERAKAGELEAALQQLQRTQSQLIQTEKMSSLGQLVAGVAHEINNPVNFIYGNILHLDDYVNNLLQLIDIYGEETQPSDAVQSYMDEIDLEFLKRDISKIISSMQVGTERIRQIVLSLRNFSRLDESEMKEVNIHEGLESTLLILQNRLRSKNNHPTIEVIKEYGNIPLIECYASELNQVFMNILSNSIDAIEEKFASDKNFSQPMIKITTGLLENDSIFVRISDNGIGMKKELQSRIFDPFFTTKQVGKGTGLGMSICYQIIVNKHQGNIHCTSELGQGTTFEITIPISQKTPEVTTLK